MAMNRIDKPAFSQPRILEQFQKNAVGARDDAAKEGGLPGKTASTAPGGEKLEISANARKMADLRRTIDQSREALAAAPDLRQERIAQARERIQAGFYDSREVREEVAGKLSQVLRRLDSLIG